MERLIPVSWTHEEHGLQAWTALSYLLYVNNNLSRAAYLAQKSNSPLKIKKLLQQLSSECEELKNQVQLLQNLKLKLHDTQKYEELLTVEVPLKMHKQE
ncbi:uncharacterized protein LOC142324704 isoform X2 [Lycorma delicatula]|uniref:uncharacterized protein LOC142324704 isoform X2 n=1 Tax=Lycorma delicatula TaxID=130591 RepID=UPI003F512D82